MTGWLGVVLAEHVQRGVSLGIAQIGHGKRAALARMHPDDTVIYYSPALRQGDRTPLRQVTAFGVVDDGEICQADDGDFHPFRRRISYYQTTNVAVADVTCRLVLTSDSHWGYQLRRGLVELDPADVEVLREVMVVGLHQREASS